MKISLFLCCSCLVLCCVNAFVVPDNRKTTKIHAASFQTSQSELLKITSISSSTTSLNERRWNFNEGQSPWGLKKNAETWNGRVAQVRFFFCF